MNLKDVLGLTGKGVGRDEMLLTETRRSWTEIVRVKGWTERIQGDGARGMRLVEQVGICESLPQRPVSSARAPHVRVIQYLFLGFG